MNNDPSTLPGTAPVLTEAALGNTSLFRNVDLEFLFDRIEKCRRRAVAAGEVVIAEGEANKVLFIVLSGRLSARLQGEHGGEAVTGLAAGDCVGEMSVIDGRPATATVVAEEPSWLLEIPAELIWTLIDRTTFVSRNLLYILAGRLRRGNLTISAGHEEISRLHTVVHKDALTGLRNRRWFDEQLDLALEQQRRTGEPLSLLLMDIDHFKRFNDTWGHPAGDAVLRRVAGAIGQSASGGMAARSGGEEFAVILPGLDEAAASAVAESVRAAVEALGAVEYDGAELPPVTVSVGVARLHGGETAASFIQRADMALYAAKDAGRNCVRAAA